MNEFFFITPYQKYHFRLIDLLFLTQSRFIYQTNFIFHGINREIMYAHIAQLNINYISH